MRCHTGWGISVGQHGRFYCNSVFRWLKENEMEDISQQSQKQSPLFYRLQVHQTCRLFADKPVWIDWNSRNPFLEHVARFCFWLCTHNRAPILRTVFSFKCWLNYIKCLHSVKFYFHLSVIMLQLIFPQGKLLAQSSFINAS